MYKFEGVVKSKIVNVKKGKGLTTIEFQIEPTSAYSIKSPNGEKTFYVAFEEGGHSRIRVLKESNLKTSFREGDPITAMFTFLSIHADTNRSVAFDVDKDGKVFH